MDYISTRGSAPTLDFAGVTLAGLASDGGLYLPAEWPGFSGDHIRDMRGLPYAELAARVMQPFVGDSLSPERLRELCEAAYGRFSHDAVTPLVQLDQRHWLLELFHGPTLAFKDVALQLLGLLFEEFLAREDKHLTIVGATSGDTGSAAIDAVAGRERIEIFMLHPDGRVSDVQRRQMTTIRAPNVHNIAIGGSFDDAQAMVKRMFADPGMAAVNLGAVNSINWARLMAQVVYYFAAAVQLGAPDRQVAFSVPTGNFGDVFAGYVAAQMGLPIARLVVATNVNDILHRAIANGDYSAGEVTPTASPSMDIQVSSNFERMLFDAGGRDGAAMAEQMRGFDATRAMQLTNLQREGVAGLMSSARADATDMSQAMRWAFDHAGQVIDPHTAIGLHAARELEIDGDIPVVTLATAHPAKFRDPVERATGIRPALPARIGNLFEREEAYETLPGDYDAVRDYVLQGAAPHG
ncbi:threonine synthase [Alteriqipengyuania flavescens]|uniref:threonine synthase n=1 Tax=Alteriqipengyuania flavescens TaxID=3053610 RepID=UPI0025B55D3C|nr:threonine synthase [Alteriqipengyuania flavescens]WJY17898.1 threonine synthase [Alteriqipengyuania flavescens]WJY23839.1 threonine synthase [Alteriqipengyuania flavescens]